MSSPTEERGTDLDELLSLRKLPIGARVTGKRLSKVETAMAEKYRAGATIRELAEITDRSYGWVQKTLDNAGVELRPRGGSYRKGTGRDRSVESKQRNRKSAATR